jgi:hypothetical protein
MNTVSKTKIIITLIFLIIFSTLFAGENTSRKYFFRSLLIPGWGELSQKNSSGYVFLTSELLLWSSRYYYLEEADLKDKASFDYAVKFANIDPNQDYSNEYFFHLKRYDSSGYETGGYNAYIVELAKNLYPEDLEAQTEYINANAYSDEYFWQWDDDNKQHEYAILRKRIIQYNDYAKTIVGAILANHLISAINSLRINSRLKRLQAGIEFNSNMNPMISIKYNF